MARKLISILLVMVLCVSMLPVSVLAQGDCTCNEVCDPAATTCTVCQTAGECGKTESEEPQKAPEEIQSAPTQTSTSPEVTDNAQSTTSPEVTDNAQSTTSPEVTDNAQSTTSPEVTDNAQSTTSPEVTDNAQTSTSPEVTDNAQTSTSPEVTDEPQESTEPTPTPVVCAHGVAEGTDCAICDLEALIASLPTFAQFIELEGDAYMAAITDIQLAQETYYNVLDDDQRAQVSNADVLLTLLNSYANQSSPEYLAEGTFESDGIQWSWTLTNEGLLTIIAPRNAGRMFYQGTYPWYSHREKITKVRFEGPVTNIGNEAFKDCINLTDIVIPDTVIRIDQLVFRNCSSLEKIVLPESITDVDYWAFENCTALEEVVLSPNLSGINISMFSGCSSLTTITNIGNWEFIRDSAFNGCSSLTSLSLPASMEVLSGGAFNGCTNLTSITFNGSNISYIAPTAFSGLSDSTTVYHPDNDLWTELTQSTYGGSIVWAKNTSLSPDIPTGIKWTYDESNNRLVFTGEGEIPSYSRSDSAPWAEFPNFILEVYIGSGITAIGANSFAAGKHQSIDTIFYGGSAESWNNLPKKSGTQFLTAASKVHYNVQADAITEHYNILVKETPTSCGDGSKIMRCSCSPDANNPYTITIFLGTGNGEHEAGGDGFCKGCGKAMEAPPQENGYYMISTPAHLIWFAESINDGSITSASNAKLVNNIAINGEAGLKQNAADLRVWTPIANGNNWYSGTFDGNGKTISGLYISGEADLVGLFSKNGGTIRDLTISDSYFQGRQSIGAIAGTAGGTISNCHTTASVTIRGRQGLGGIAGEANNVISGCTNRAAISFVHLGNATNNSAQSFGGIAGSFGDDMNGSKIIRSCTNYGTINGNIDTGGIAGYVQFGTISDCLNAGAVTGNRNVGGIVGFISSLSSSGTNTGLITGSKNTATVSGKSSVGGICGRNSGSCSITYCFNYGTVTNADAPDGYGSIGGICGDNYAIVQKCAAECSVIANKNSNAGGICGHVYYSGGAPRSRLRTIADDGSTNTIGNGYFKGSASGGTSGAIAATLDAGASIGHMFTSGSADAVAQNNGGSVDVSKMTNDQFASGEVCWLLNNGSEEGSLTWYQNIGSHSAPTTAANTDHIVYRRFNGCQVVFTNTPGTLSETQEDHVLRYKADDSAFAIVEYCENCNYHETATLNFNERNYEASISYSAGWNGGKDLAPVYKQGSSELAEVPSAPGDYTVSFTRDDITISKDFTVAAKTGQVTTLVQNAELNDMGYTADMMNAKAAGMDKVADVNRENIDITLTLMLGYFIERMYPPNSSPYGSSLSDANEKLEILLQKSTDDSQPPVSVEDAGAVLEIQIPYSYKYKTITGMRRAQITSTGIVTEGFTVLTQRPADNWKDLTYFADTQNEMLYVYTQRFGLFGINTSVEPGSGTVSTAVYTDQFVPLGYGTDLPDVQLIGLDTIKDDFAIEGEDVVVSAMLYYYHEPQGDGFSPYGSNRFSDANERFTMDLNWGYNGSANSIMDNSTLMELKIPFDNKYKTITGLQYAYADMMNGSPDGIPVYTKEYQEVSKDAAPADGTYYMDTADGILHIFTMQAGLFGLYYDVKKDSGSVTTEVVPEPDMPDDAAIDLTDVSVTGMDKVAEANKVEGTDLKVALEFYYNHDTTNSWFGPDEADERIHINLGYVVDAMKLMISDAGTVLELKIGLAEGKVVTGITRAHETFNDMDMTVDFLDFTELTAKPTKDFTDGTFFMDKENHCVYIYSQYYSEFGVTYADGAPDITTATVTYQADGKTVTTRVVALGGTVSDVPAVPAKTGYTGKWEAEAKDVKADMTIKAVYTPNTYTVSFDPNGGKTPSVTEQTVTYGNAYGKLPTTTKDGLYFAGWYTAKTGGIRVYDTTMVTTDGNHTLYAHWSVNPPTGDSVSTAQIAALTGALVLSLAALTALVVCKKRKEN